MKLPSLACLLLLASHGALAAPAHVLHRHVSDITTQDGPQRRAEADRERLGVYRTDLGLGVFGPSFVETYGDDTGRVYAMAFSGLNPREELSGTLLWTKTYIRGSGAEKASFTILKSWAELINYEHALVSAEFEIIVSIATFRDGTNVTPVFNHFVRIEGGDGAPYTYIEYAAGDRSGSFSLHESENRVVGAIYDIDGLTRDFDLSGILPGEHYGLGYTLVARTFSAGGEAYASAFIADPLNLVPMIDDSELTEATSTITATCNIDFPPTTPTSQFVIAEALATDSDTGLQWLRCPEGTVWDDAGTPSDLLDDNCLSGGTTNFTWQDALQQVEAINIAGTNGGGWRLPNVKELASIVELQCGLPAANQVVFPGIASADYWTGSPDIGADGGAMWTVDFTSGSISAVPGSATFGAILVRDAEVIVDDMLFSDGFEG